MKRTVALVVVAGGPAVAGDRPAQVSCGRGRPTSSCRRRVLRDAGAAAVRIEQVRAGVVIRGQVATTMIEVRLRNPSPGPAGGRAADARARRGGGPRVLLRRAEPASPRRGSCRATRPARPMIGSSRRRATRPCWSSPATTWSAPASSRSRPAATQAVRLTYEHLLTADGDRIDYVLPRSESVEYRVPWKVSVRIDAAGPIAAVYSPSHQVRTSRPSADVALVELEAEAATDPGPFRLSYLRERERGLRLAVRVSRPSPRRRILPAPGRLAPRAEGRGRGDPPRGDAGHRPLGQHARREARPGPRGRPAGDRRASTTARRSTSSSTTRASTRSPRPVRKSRETEREAAEFLDEMTARGGTNIHDALLEALRPAAGRGDLADRPVHDRRPGHGRARPPSRRSATWPASTTRTASGSSASASAWT